MASLNVARIVERLPPEPGGKELHAAELSDALLDSEDTRTMLFFRSGASPKRHASVRAVCPPGQRFGRKRFALWSIRAVANAHATTPFDVIHAHGDIPEAFAAAYLSRMLDVPAILTIHGGLSRNSVHNALRASLFSAMQTVIVVSDEIKADLDEIGVSSRLTVCSSGVREAFFDVPHKVTDSPVVICVGRLAMVKGYELVAAAATALPNIKWKVFGGGNDGYAETIRKKLHDSGVEVLHEEDAQALASEMANASVLLVPSVDLDGEREGTPTAALEALATGTPIIASKVSGLRHLANRGAPIQLYSPHEPKAVATAITEVLSSPRPAVHDTRQYVQGWAAVAQTIQREYREAIHRSSRRAAVFATAWLEVGGAEHFMLALASHCIRKGNHTVVAGALGSLVDSRPDGTEYIRLNRGNGPATLLRNTASLAAAFVRTKPAVVNVHHFPTGVSTVVALWLCRIPARRCLTVHVSEKASSEPIIGLFGPLLFDQVLPVSANTRQKLAMYSLPWRRSRLSVIRAGAPPAQQVVGDPKTIGVVARLVERKGHRHLLAALKILKDDGTLPGWSVEIWGDGPLRGELESISYGYGLEDHVTFRGTVSNAVEHLHRLGIIVLPSTREGLPLLLIEAMAAGCAIVGTRLPGVEELVGESRAAILVDPANPVRLADALRKVVSSTKERIDLREAALSRYEADFTEERMLAIYDEALGL